MPIVSFILWILALKKSVYYINSCLTFQECNSFQFEANEEKKIVHYAEWAVLLENQNHKYIIIV